MSTQSTTTGALRAGSDYLDSLNDGRRVWVGGEEIDDLRSHPATAGIVATYAAWYDRLRDPAWSERLLTNDGQPIAYEPPRSRGELRRLQEVITLGAFEAAGNVTHDPGFGSLTMLGVREVLAGHAPADRVQAITDLHSSFVVDQRFGAASYPPVISDRFQPPAEQLRPSVVAEKDDGIVVRGMVGLGTAMPFSDMIFTAPLPGPLAPERAIWFAFHPAAAGVRLLARQPSSHRHSASEFPLSSRYDELEATVVLDDVFVPWEQVFLYRDVELSNHAFDGHVMWAAFHHLARMLGRVEYTIGLALAITDALGTRRNPAVQNVIVDMIFHAETIKASLVAACADATMTPGGIASPHMRSMAAGTKYALEGRARFADTARTLAGFGSMLAPVPGDFDDPEIGSWIERAYGGGGWTGRQRASLLHLVRDHLASALDAREAAFEAMASGGTHLWQLRLRISYDRYDELAARAIAAVDGDAPVMDFSGLREIVGK